MTTIGPSNETRTKRLVARFERRLTPSRAMQVLVTPLSLILALAAGGGIMLLTGINPLEAYKVMIVGALGSTYSISETLLKATPLILTSVAACLAFKIHFWNVGIEGQLVMGGFFAGAVALKLPLLWPAVPSPILLALMLVAGCIGGALWGLIPALLRVFLDVNAILTTVLMNQIAIMAVMYMYLVAWRDPEGWGFPGSPIFPEAATLPHYPGMRVHLGLVIALVVAFIVWIIISRTRWGYQIKVIGENPRTARYGGMNVAGNTLLVMAISGGLAGMAGMVEVSGVMHRLMEGLSVGNGYSAIMVAYLARLHPLASILVSFLLAVLLVGGDQLQTTMALPSAFGIVLQGVILFMFLGGSIFENYRLRIGFREFIRHKAAPKVPPPAAGTAQRSEE